MSAASEREKVLAEFMPCSGEVCKGCELICQHEDGRTPQAEWMADEIVRLRETIRHLACPRCGTVNPPEVHTCTPRAKVWKVEDEWRLYDRVGVYTSRVAPEDLDTIAKRYDKRYPDYAPHTVKRVALIDTDTGEGEG